MNEPKLFNFNGQPTIDSREVAKMIGKRHTDLIRDIRRYIGDMTPDAKLRPAQFFIESNYKDANGQFRPCYLLTKMGCELVANKMTGKKGTLFTAKYVNLFNDYQQQLITRPQFRIPQTYAEALQLAATQTKKLEEQQPTIDYFNSQMRNPGLMTITEIAKDYGWSARRMNKELEKRHIQFKRGGKWFLYQKYCDKGYTQFEPFPYEKSNGVQGLHNNLKWTQKGKKFIYDVLAKDGIYPVLERESFLESKENTRK